MIEDLLAAIALVAHYTICVGGAYVLLRRFFGIAASVAVAVPLSQAALSFVYQSAFLLSLSFLYPIGALGLFIYCGWLLTNGRGYLSEDLFKLIDRCKAHRLLSSALGVVLIYSLAQVLWIVPKNHDALTYHLPRVFLFLQQDTLLLSAFSRHHQAIFPVGADILFLPFVHLNTMLGLSIYSLSSYLSLGAASYALARRHGSEQIAIAAGCIVTCLPVIALQSVSVKNDILMTGAGTAAVLLTAVCAKNTRFDINCLLLVVLCSFGISCKTTFIAFLPGLAIFFLSHPCIRNVEILKRSVVTIKAHWPTTILALSMGLVLSQVWLFAWNARTHESWSGPRSFTERHQQHDGLAGAGANAVRYGIQILQAGPWADQVLTNSLGLKPFSKQINETYEATLQPTLGDAGASREPFEVTWRLHEDLTWFGPFGALIFFILLPIALVRRPRVALELTPALVYFFLICALVSWMPWNGRFFTLFFVTLTPAIAVALNGCSQRLVKVLLTLSLLSLVSTKIFDFARPALPIAQALYEHEEKDAREILSRAMKIPNIWTSAHRAKELHFGDPSSILDQIEPGSSIGIYIYSHLRHYGFYQARPDLKWFPLNHFSGIEALELNDAWKLFLTSDMDYLLCAGIYSSDFDSLLLRSSEDGTTKLIRHPRHALGIDP